MAASVSLVVSMPSPAALPSAGSAAAAADDDAVSLVETGSTVVLVQVVLVRWSNAGRAWSRQKLQSIV